MSRRAHRQAHASVASPSVWRTRTPVLRDHPNPRRSLLVAPAALLAARAREPARRVTFHHFCGSPDLFVGHTRRRRETFRRRRRV